ncbi:unnamed protein product [Aphanomyces euteiches]|uniref:Uncharacterized protein n=1 Tax=Aphanomyces euteiches TaxID=100861 RepID=A0A6G0XB72_9STRA|nr:hypothetical protein Ae201684_006488 [Aphanomyces euteiches]KAH9091144.1 hypothetical protein Ae201684P_006544 [Aphanomyces euteiches]KAH9196719.1 hypothetical protein AeNC1_001293 [Aphanomyces euteiches]
MFARRLLRVAQRPIRRGFSSQGPAPHSGANDNSSFFQLLAMGSFVGLSVYIYRDPDVLPESIRKFMPIQKPEGKSMTLEEYEAWRAKQSTPSAAPAITGEKKNVTVQVDEAPTIEIDPTEVVAPHSKAPETKESLQQALELARSNESTFLAELKASKAPLTDEDKELLQAFRNEKARIKKELKALTA